MFISCFLRLRVRLGPEPGEARRGPAPPPPISAAIRHNQHVFGYPWCFRKDQKKLGIGNITMRCCVRILGDCATQRAPAGREDPRTLLMWACPPMVAIIAAPHSVVVGLCQCQWNVRWRKPTRSLPVRRANLDTLHRHWHPQGISVVIAANHIFNLVASTHHQIVLGPLMPKITLQHSQPTLYSHCI